MNRTHRTNNFCRALASVALAMILPGVAQAATTLDAAFGNNGRYIVSPPVGYQFFRTLAHLPRPGGGSVAVVYYRHDNPAFCPADRDCIGLYPFNAAGAMTGALTVPIGLNFSTVGGAAIDSQGRIVVVGSIQRSGNDHDFQIIRLLPDGTADTSFSGDGITSVAFDIGDSLYDRANAVKVDSQDRIVVVGRVAMASNDTDFGIARLTTSGMLDTSFNGNGRRTIAFDLGTTNLDDEATSVAIGNDQRIVIGGHAMVDGSLLGYARVALAKLHENGSYDTSFCQTTCNFMGGYTSIHSGRRVTYVGSLNATDSDALAALSLAYNGRILTAGTRRESGQTLAYVQTFAPNGEWVGETTSNGGVDDSSGYHIGGVHYTGSSPTADIVLTGASGPMQELFFAQRLTHNLTPVANWGFIGPGNSVYLWNGSNGFGDAEFNFASQSSLDAQGRILTGGSFKATTSSPYSAAMARLTDGVAPSGPGIFANGFEP